MRLPSTYASPLERARVRAAGTTTPSLYVIPAKLVPAKAGSGNPPRGAGCSGGVPCAMLHGEQHPDRVEAHQLAPQEATSRQLYRDTPALSPLQDLRTARQLLPVYEPNTLRLASSNAASVAARAASSLSRRATYYESESQWAVSAFRAASCRPAPSVLGKPQLWRFAALLHCGFAVS